MLNVRGPVGWPQTEEWIKQEPIMAADALKAILGDLRISIGNLHTMSQGGARELKAERDKLSKANDVITIWFSRLEPVEKRMRGGELTEDDWAYLRMGYWADLLAEYRNRMIS